MRRAGRVVAEVLDLVEGELRPGVSTAHLDGSRGAHSKAGGSALVQGLLTATRPRSAISIDREGCPRIPGHRTSPMDKVVSIDAGAISRLPRRRRRGRFIVGDVPQAVATSVATTRLGLGPGIAAAISGNRIWDISAAVEDVPCRLAMASCGPYVRARDRHRDARGSAGPELRTKTKGDRAGAGHLPGDRADVHPGNADVKTLADGWTVVTRDRSVAAHFEDSIASPRTARRSSPGCEPEPVVAGTGQS